MTRSEASSPNRRDILLASTTLAAAAAAGTAVPVQTAQAQLRPTAPSGPPNIVYFLVDNLGYGELGCYGGGILRGVRRIDAFAAEGMKLLNFAPEAQCTPSRSALMTGRYAIRSGNHTVALPGEEGGLVAWEKTMGDILSARGYATACVGKWHIGESKGRWPTDHGFDEWYGPPRTWDESLWPEANDRVIDGVDQRAFFEGHQETSAREGFPYWMGDTLYGVKWRNFKLVMYLQKTLTDPALKLPTLHIINLTVDPKERRALDVPYLHSWTAVHFGKILKDFAESVKARAADPSGCTADPRSGARRLAAMNFIDIFPWIVFVLVLAIVAAVFVALGMMPGHIARKRGHPWAEAVTVGGWATLICGFVFWPLVLIWAYVDVPARRETAP
jgi:uncharacterized protein DUF3302/sulfatase-like protein